MPAPPLPPSSNPDAVSPDAAGNAAPPVFDRPGSRVGRVEAATTHGAGEAVDAGRGRVFPCPNCGADLVFEIGQQRMKCPYCGYEEAIELPAEAKVEERDFAAMLASLEEHHDADRDSYAGMKEVRCVSCGGVVVFQGALTSTRCPYCASPIQIDRVEQAKDRIDIDGVLPFLVDRATAATNLGDWVKSRWFAPNDFLERGVQADFNGVYLPYWTFDALTFTRYSGQRGEHYWVTVGTGKNQSRQRRTRWYAASGDFQRFFDDVLVNGSRGLDQQLILELEPWPLAQCAAYNQQMLAGFLARAYEVELPTAFKSAKERMAAALAAEVRARIGGDEQQVSSIDTRHNAVTFKLILLPVWMMAYRYGGAAHQVLVNAATGEVQGGRPYSWIKITLATIAGIIAALVLYFILMASQN